MTSKIWNNRDFFAAKLQNLRIKNELREEIRHFFAENGFCEVDTPILQKSPGLEVHLQAFATEFAPITADEKKELYLHTSPEFAMKKLMAAGMEKIYQFAHVFRNGEVGPRHHPEFTMLEWYRAEVDYNTLMADCEEILVRTLKICQRDAFSYGDFRADLKTGIEVLSVEEAFKKYCGFSILATIDNPAAPAPGGLFEKAQKMQVNAQEHNTWEDLFFKIMGKYIEPYLGVGRPTILCEYPISMAALSRPKPGDAQVAERFELFVCGLELANAFSEMRDVQVQRQRFMSDMKEKERLYGSSYPIDEDFMDAMGKMPECAGIALGFERLLMVGLGLDDINDALFLPVDLA